MVSLTNSATAWTQAVLAAMSTTALLVPGGGTAWLFHGGFDHEQFHGATSVADVRTELAHWRRVREWSARWGIGPVGDRVRSAVRPGGWPSPGSRRCDVADGLPLVAAVC